MQDVQAFGVSSHQTIFDAVVDHLYEVARAVWPAMEITLFGGAVAHLFAPGRAGDIANSGSDRRKDRIKPRHRLALAANHQASSPFYTPHTTACTDVDVVHSLCL